MALTPNRREFFELAVAAGLTPLLRTRPAVSPGESDSPKPAGDPDGRLQGELSLTFAGDLYLTRETSGLGGSRNDFAADLLGRSDASFLNLENGLSTVGSSELGGFPYGAAIRGDPELVEDLVELGVSAVSLANNHTGNFGRRALVQTMDTLEAAGIEYAGAGENRREAFSPAYVDVRGRRIAFHSAYSLYQKYAANDRAGPDTPGLASCLAYDVLVDRGDTLSPEGMRAESDPAYLVPRVSGTSDVVMASFREDVEHLQRSLRQSARHADLVVLSVHFHWGRHRRQDIPVHQRSLTHAAVDAGADLVVGHGPHILRGVEIYRGAPIFYSLSNIRLFPVEEGEEPPPDDALSRRSVVIRLVLGSGSARVEIDPIVFGLDGHPEAPDASTASEILSNLGGLSAPFGTVVEDVDGVGRIHLDGEPARPESDR